MAKPPFTVEHIGANILMNNYDSISWVTENILYTRTPRWNGYAIVDGKTCFIVTEEEALTSDKSDIKQCSFYDRWMYHQRIHFLEGFVFEESRPKSYLSHMHQAKLHIFLDQLPPHLSNKSYISARSTLVEKFGDRLIYHPASNQYRILT